MKGFHYLNTSFTPLDAQDFTLSMSPNIPSDILTQLFLRSVGIKYNTVIPTNESKPVGYCVAQYDPATQLTKIRQVVRVGL